MELTLADGATATLELARPYATLSLRNRLGDVNTRLTAAELSLLSQLLAPTLPWYRTAWSSCCLALRSGARIEVVDPSGHSCLTVSRERRRGGPVAVAVRLTAGQARELSRQLAHAYDRLMGR